MAEVAEPLVVEPLVAVALEQRPDRGDEPIAWNEIGIQRPQPRAEHTAAYEQAVLVQRTTDEREVGGVGSRAAVGAPGHPDRERRIRNTQSLELGLELRDHVRQRPLRLGDREPAGRERGARHGPAPHDRERSVTAYAVVGQDPVHQPPVSVGNISQQQVLLRSEADTAADGLDHAAQRAPQPAVLAVPDAAVLDEHAQEGASLTLLVPPEMVLDTRHLDRCGGRERTAELTLHLLAKPVQSLLVEQVLE